MSNPIYSISTVTIRTDHTGKCEIVKRLESAGLPFSVSGEFLNPTITIPATMLQKILDCLK